MWGLAVDYTRTFQPGRLSRLLHRFCIALCCILCLGVLVGAEARPDTALENPLAGNRDAVVLGEIIFTAQCAARCHPTESGWAGGKYPDLLDCEWPRGGSDAEIFRTVMDGVPKTEMPGWKGKLKDEAVWQVIAYLRAESACGVTTPVTTAPTADPPRVVAKIETQTSGQTLRDPHKMPFKYT